MTGPPIPYDELLAAHRDAIDQRDRARRIAVTLEQELAQVEAHVAWLERELWPFLGAVASATAATASARGVPVPDLVAAFAAAWEARAAFGDQP